MWYSGGEFPVAGGDFLIGHATSVDGISWTKDESNPVLDKDTTGAWDDRGVFDPSVLLFENTFHMWFSGYSDDGLYHSIGHATSSDGVTWIRDAGNPVLEEGASGKWDELGVISPAVIYDGSEYHMYFHAQGNLSSEIFIGHATSTDGVEWTKDPQNPILSPGASGSWDQGEVIYADAVYHENTFHMWYCGGEFLAWDIGYATSEDGSTWTKSGNNPVLTNGTIESWEAALVSIPSVIIDSSMFKMWYRGQQSDNTGGIGYAKSEFGIPDGVTNVNSGQINIYPNPASDLINLQTNEIGEHTIEITSVNGQLILSFKRSGSFHQIDLSSLQKGLYFITISLEDNVITRKIIKK
jgi:predicted GH43/DUF377 family glycosyl hydrolase